MERVSSLPKLPEPKPKPVTVDIAISPAWQKDISSVTHGAQTIFRVITEALADGKGCLIGRHGTIELTTVLQHIYQENNPFDKDRALILERNAGIFPSTPNSVRDWCVAYTRATLEADVLALGWYKPLARAEWSMVDILNPKVEKIPLRSLEPYYTEPVSHWTRALEAQHVCVVSSFAKTMEDQLNYRRGIWPMSYETLLPNAQWSFVRSYYSPVTAAGRCEWPHGVKSWSDAVDYLEQEVLKTGARVVLLGCGGLAMPLGRRLKAKGIVCIVMGGAIQVLFGIKGRRWASHDIIRSFWTDGWVYPSVSEVPGAAGGIEGGCYW